MDQANILVVGAGGIGCELIKTLVLSGAKRLTVIDLDQIDKSNLNRQFLFTKKDVGRSKALVAAEVISSLRPSVQIKGLYENVFNLKHDFFEEFNLVFNALDNLAARRYVNRICVFLGKAFIDAGTRGKNGQVTVHVPHVSMCYDCRPKATPKQYAVCTIRSTPSIIEHCIAWGKYLYEALFGPEDNSNILSELASARTCTTEELFDLLFKQGLPAQATALKYPTEVAGQLYSDMFATLNFKQLVNTLDFSFTSLKSRPSIHFDKNDKLSVHFITSVSNLRCLNFGIQCKCLSSVQEIAGNIIPAIGSTNAIVAGLQVIEGLKILSGKTNFGAVWVQQSSSNNKFIFPSQPEEPDKNCFVCSSGKCFEELDLEKTLLSELINKVLIQKLNFLEPCLFRGDSILYESGEGIEEDLQEIYDKNCNRTLKDLNIASGEELLIVDSVQNCKFVLILRHKPEEVVENQELKRPRDPESSLIIEESKIDLN